MGVETSSEEGVLPPPDSREMKTREEKELGR